MESRLDLIEAFVDDELRKLIQLFEESHALYMCYSS